GPSGLRSRYRRGFGRGQGCRYSLAVGVSIAARQLPEPLRRRQTAPVTPYERGAGGVLRNRAKTALEVFGIESARVTNTTAPRRNFAGQVERNDRNNLA